MEIFYEESASVTICVLNRGLKEGERPATPVPRIPLLTLFYDGVNKYVVGDGPMVYQLPTSLVVYIPNTFEHYEGYSFLAHQADFLRPMLVGWSYSEKELKANVIYSNQLPASDLSVVVTPMYANELAANTSTSGQPPAQWQPSQGQLVKVDGARGIYRIEDIDVYEGNFILSEADSARRHRNNGRSSRDEFGAPRHYRDDAYIGGTPVPFDKVKPFYLPL